MKPQSLNRLAVAGLGLVCLALAFVGCSESLNPAGEPEPREDTGLAAMAAQVRSHLEPGLPVTVPADLDMGAIHNDILRAVETRRRLDADLTRDEFVTVYARAAQEALAQHGVQYTVTPELVESFLAVFDAFHREHALQAPQALLTTMEQEQWITGGQRKRLEQVLAGESVEAATPAETWAMQVQRASRKYWVDTGRLSPRNLPGTEGWLKDLFVVASDTVGGVLGGLLGAGTGTIVGGPAGGTVGAVVGGPLGAGAFSGVAIMALECVCSQ